MSSNVQDAGATPVRGAALAAKGRAFAGGTSVLSIIGGLLIWEVAANYIVRNPLFLAPPSAIILEIWTLLRLGELQKHIAVSGTEFGIGLAISIVLGIGIGFVLVASKTANAALGPWVAALYATPTVAIAPLIILWLGIDLWSKVVVVVINATFPMIINTEAGLRAVDKKLVETVRSLGAKPHQIFFHVALPSAIPYILAGVRLAVGRAIVSVVVGEMFGSRAGLGFMLVQASEVFNMSRLFAAVTILAVGGVTLTSLARWLELRVQPWNSRT